ncbi:MAG: SDR family oxidoreductase [Minicystis sp.]
MKGKVTMVTGATAGIGKVTALELAKMGATVFAVGRDPAKGEAAISEIRRISGNQDVHLLLCDFSSQSSIRKLAAEFTAKHDRLHVLVNNAGAILAERRVTEDGVEATFATNHMGYFLLTNLLLDVLKATAPARIVSVASEAHKSTKLDLDDLQYERRAYAPMGAYGASKLANIAWSAELARRLEGTRVTANSLHPGVIASNFGQSGPSWMRFGIKLAAPFMTTPEKGAATTLYLATSPEVEGVTGQYFKNKKAAQPNRQARDPETGRRLWAASEALVKQVEAKAA